MQVWEEEAGCVLPRMNCCRGNEEAATYEQLLYTNLRIMFSWFSFHHKHHSTHELVGGLLHEVAAIATRTWRKLG